MTKEGPGGSARSLRQATAVAASRTKASVFIYLACDQLSYQEMAQNGHSCNDFREGNGGLGPGLNPKDGAPKPQNGSPGVACARQRQESRAWADERLKARLFLQIPPPPKEVAPNAKRVLRIRRDVTLEQADRFVLLAEQRVHERFHGDEVVLGIELRRSTRP